ncbi:MAG: hypothetical protein ACFCBU_02475 [Cyanophyceae cyanobacterium]
MNRDALNALVTAILMVVGLIALNPGSIRGDRHSAFPAPCDFLNTCAPESGYDDNGETETPQTFPKEHRENPPSSITATYRKSTVSHKVAVD